MYIPDHSQTNNSELIKNLIDTYSFITLISIDDQLETFLSHLPVVTQFDGTDQLISIKGHLSKKNPHYEILNKNKKVKLIFHGPHHYITPLWYKSGRDVPTWAYCVVHVSGELTLKENFEDICENLKDLTNKFEYGEERWSFELPPDLQNSQSLTQAIVAFEVKPHKIESKFKLNQKRPAIDQISVIKSLGELKTDMSNALVSIMKKIYSSS